MEFWIFISALEKIRNTSSKWAELECHSEARILSRWIILQDSRQTHQGGMNMYFWPFWVYTGYILIILISKHNHQSWGNMGVGVLFHLKDTRNFKKMSPLCFYSWASCPISQLILATYQPISKFGEKNQAMLCLVSVSMDGCKFSVLPWEFWWQQTQWR